VRRGQARQRHPHHPGLWQRLRALAEHCPGEFGDRPCRLISSSHISTGTTFQGYSVFLPLYKKGNTFFSTPVCARGSELQQNIEGMMVSPYFSGRHERHGSGAPHFIELGEAPVNINGQCHLRAAQSSQGCVGYRSRADGGAVVLATDTEPGSASTIAPCVPCAGCRRSVV